jgi:hypothetical protein
VQNATDLVLWFNSRRMAAIKSGDRRPKLGLDLFQQHFILMNDSSAAATLRHNQQLDEGL